MKCRSCGAGEINASSAHLCNHPSTSVYVSKEELQDRWGSQEYCLNDHTVNLAEINTVFVVLEEIGE